MHVSFVFYCAHFESLILQIFLFIYLSFFLGQKLQLPLDSNHIMVIIGSPALENILIINKLVQ